MTQRLPQAPVTSFASTGTTCLEPHLDTPVPAARGGVAGRKRDTAPGEYPGARQPQPGAWASRHPFQGKTWWWACFRRRFTTTLSRPRSKGPLRGRFTLWWASIRCPRSPGNNLETFALHGRKARAGSAKVPATAKAPR